MSSVHEKTIATYDKIATQYSASHYDPRYWQREFLIFQELVEGRTILDVGCGAGIDASRAMLNEAKRRVPRGRFLLMDFHHLQFPRAAFDGFWAAASLLHIPKRRLGTVLRGISRALKPKGVGFISVKEKRVMGEGILREERYGGSERYFAFYTGEEFRKQLEVNGFSVLRSHRKREGDTIWLCYFVRKI